MKGKDNYTYILGAGALGAMYAAQISRRRLPVAFLVDDERAVRLERDGVTVNDELLDVPVVRWSDVGGTAPVPSRILVALKDQHLPGVANRLSSVSGPDTTLISVMNGIDSERQMAEALGEPLAADERGTGGAGDVADTTSMVESGKESTDTGRVLHCMVKGMDAVREGSAVRYTRLGVVVFGRRRNDPVSPDPRVAGMQRFFDAAEIPWETPPDMDRELWNKFMLNVGINQWSAVLRATYGVFHTHESARNLMRRAMREVLVIAVAREIDLREEDIDRWFSVVNTLSPEGKTSMLQDIEGRRKTEVEMFAGRVVEMGRESGIATPVNEILLDAIHTLEAANGS
ncbi:MAG: ketopantoate reductase family protein [Alkalispirochaeta sp.]